MVLAEAISRHFCTYLQTLNILYEAGLTQNTFFKEKLYESLIFIYILCMIYYQAQ